ncbi:uncharacterized protein LOC110987302 isoform X2 [Acanthaster planci]|uniref:Uncharacterized protein LOC110987302 isoform X2 n=1 Tax=Acanthaster planci TaxID=133434 RepID=A0A8B7ZQ98_ACAPL|nr:uncharacterized protein LOC110987302 isoform X2 [Acanthaster planci]
MLLGLFLCFNRRSMTAGSFYFFVVMLMCLSTSFSWQPNIFGSSIKGHKDVDDSIVNSESRHFLETERKGTVVTAETKQRSEQVRGPVQFPTNIGDYSEEEMGGYEYDEDASYEDENDQGDLEAGRGSIVEEDEMLPEDYEGNWLVNDTVDGSEANELRNFSRTRHGQEYMLEPSEWEPMDLDPLNDGSMLVVTMTSDDFDASVYEDRIVRMVSFFSAGCEECEKFRPHFRKAAKKIWLTEQESEENVEVIFYEVTDPQLLVRFNLKVLPTVFFFRSGVPILYEGDLNADALVSWALAHFKVLSWALTDKNFDKLTAGTKDLDSTVRWLVHFCDVDAVGCDGFMATWESAASRLKDQVEFGYVDVGVEAGLVKQFNVDLDNLPAVVLLKQGQAYWCTLPLIELTTDSIVHFVKEGYKKIEEEHMPAKLSTLMTLMVKVGANTKGIGIMLVATAILLYVIYICFCRKRPLPDVGKEKGV